MRLLALDPGKTTGWSLWHYDAITPLTLDQRGQVEGGLAGLLQFMARVDIDEVVAETFRLDGRTPKPDVTPLRIEGALSVVFPGWIGQANTCKRSADDLFLKRNQLWFSGLPHATDSARHALHLLKVRRHMPTIRRYWPDPRGENA
jgi:hypothetical protein